MTPLDYLLDSALVLLVLLQIKERRLTTRTMLRPLVILAVAVANYLHGIPTAGNDLVLIVVLCSIGGLIGAASGQALKMRVLDGVVLARAGFASAFFWVLGMGSRFGFLIWIDQTGGERSLAHFSAAHSITSAEAWTAALLGMAVFEVLGRMAVMTARRRHLEATIAQPQFA
jgi:hypothetical protein